MKTSSKAFYFETFYPFQDQVLQLLTELDTGFYLTGGTAASRGYLHHRFSDDLDLFVNDDDRFELWASHADWEAIRWIQAPEPEMFLRELHELGERLVLGK